MLEQAGHQVLTAETSGRAVELLTSTDSEIVIMDLCLPELVTALGDSGGSRIVCARKAGCASK